MGGRGLVGSKDREERLTGLVLRLTTRMFHPRPLWDEHMRCKYSIKLPKRFPKRLLISYILTMSTLARSKRLCPTGSFRSRSSSVTFLGCMTI